MSDTPSLPETIWWCERHEWPAFMSTYCGRPNPQMCRMVELRVAGRDDLLIRREDYDAAVERAHRMFRSWLVEDNDAPLRSAVKAALAAAEGGEG